MIVYELAETRERLHAPEYVMTCDECKKAVDILVQLGDEPDYESNTTWVCPDCLKEALALCATKQQEPKP